jgi:hypothetical protein
MMAACSHAGSCVRAWPGSDNLVHCMCWGPGQLDLAVAGSCSSRFDLLYAAVRLLPACLPASMMDGCCSAAVSDTAACDRHGL